MSITYSLDKRCQEILKIVMYAGGYVKAQDLADELHISKRSIYYDITKINEWLETNHLPTLIQERGKGILAPTQHISIIQTFLDSQEGVVLNSITPDERHMIEICTIFVKAIVCTLKILLIFAKSAATRS